MRILKVAQTYHPYLAGGGLPTKVRSIATNLTRRGHQVTVLTADLGPTPENGEPRMADRSRWGWRTAADGVEGIYLRTLLRYRTVTLNPAVLNFCRRMLKSYDVVHFYGLYDVLGPSVAWFCRRWGIPYVVEPMGMFRPIVRNLWLKNVYLRLLGNTLIKGAARLLATSEQELQELIKGGIPDGKVILRRNGIDLPDKFPARGTFRSRWNLSADSKLVLFLGRLVSKKSPDLALKAFAGWLKATDQNQAAVLVLAGPTESAGYEGQLKSLAEGLGVRDRVLFTGPLYGETKWAAYQDADVFVLPSQNENFGNAVLEALACGTPVIVTDRCGVAPLVEGRAGLVIRHDQDALQRALARLLEDRLLREDFGARSRELVDGLSWEEPVAEMETLYSRLIHPARSAVEPLAAAR